MPHIYSKISKGGNRNQKVNNKIHQIRYNVGGNILRMVGLKMQVYIT